MVYLRMMKKKNLFMLFSVPALLFQACTTEVGYSPSESSTNVSPTYKAKDRSDLPACKGEFENIAVRVQTYSNVHEDYLCSDGFWILIGKTEDVSATSKLLDISETSAEAKATRQNLTNVRKSSITDSRDGRTYKVIEFEGVTWMAENLDYETDYSKVNTECEKRGLKCGLLYNWRDAVNGGENYSDLCPSGFRLPEEDDVVALENFVGVNNVYLLKSTDYWDTEDCREGTDEIGFNALPVGYRDDSYTAIQDFGYVTGFWTDKSGGYQQAYIMEIMSYREYIGWYLADQYDYYSIRCVKD
jgi:uncharacterized protein (TIGR02145 family)